MSVVPVIARRNIKLIMRYQFNRGGCLPPVHCRPKSFASPSPPAPRLPGAVVRPVRSTKTFFLGLGPYRLQVSLLVATLMADHKRGADSKFRCFMGVNH